MMQDLPVDLIRTWVGYLRDEKFGLNGAFTPESCKARKEMMAKDLEQIADWLDSGDFLVRRRPV